MLGLTCRTTKSLKALNEQLRAVVWQAVALKPVWVFLAATVICVPCFAEVPTVDRAKVAPELVSSGKVPWKDLDQGTVKRMAAKPGENGRVDSGAEGGSGSGETSAALTPERQAMSGNVAKQDNDSAYECGDYCGFYGWIPLILAWPLLFGMKKTPNVEVSGLRGFWRRSARLPGWASPA